MLISSILVKSSFSLDGDVLTQVQKGGKTGELFWLKIEKDVVLFLINHKLEFLDKN